MRKLFILLTTLLTLGCQSSNLLIDDEGFKGHVINKTTLRTTNLKHLFTKRTKTFRSVLWRTEEGRLCEVFHTRTFQLKKKGIKLIFIYSGYDKRKERKLDKIEFSKRKYFLKNGVKINESKLSVVDSLYKEVTSFKNDKGVSKTAGNIEFFSFYANNTDTSEANLIINKIELKMKVENKD